MNSIDLIRCLVEVKEENKLNDIIKELKKEDYEEQYKSFIDKIDIDENAKPCSTKIIGDGINTYG